MRNKKLKDAIRHKANARREYDKCVSHWLRHDGCGPDCPVNVANKARLYPLQVKAIAAIKTRGHN